MDSLGLTDRDLSNDSTSSEVDEKLYCSGTFELGTSVSRIESLSSSSLSDVGEHEKDRTSSSSSLSSSSSSSSSSVLDILEKESLTNMAEANGNKDNNVETISLCIYDIMRENILDDYMLSFSFDSDDDIYVDSGLSLDDDDRHYDQTAIENGLFDVSFDETYDDDNERVVMNNFPALPTLGPIIDDLLYGNTCSSDSSRSTQSSKEIVENTKETKAFDCIHGRLKPSPPRKLLNRLTKTILKSDGSSERKQDSMGRKISYKQLLKYKNMKKTDCHHLLSTNCSAEFEEQRDDCDTKRDTKTVEAATTLVVLAKTLMKRVKNRRDKNYLPIPTKEEPCRTISPVNTSHSCSSMIDDSYQVSLEENKHTTDREDKYQIKSPRKDLWVIEEYLHEESSQGSWFVEETAENCFLSYQRSFNEEQFIETLFPLSYNQRDDEETKGYKNDQEPESSYVDRYSVSHFSEEKDTNDTLVMKSQGDFESNERNHPEQRFCRRSVEERSLVDETVRSSNKHESHSSLPKGTIVQPQHINYDECQEMMVLPNAPENNITKTHLEQVQSVKKLARFFEGKLGLNKHYDCTCNYMYKTTDDKLDKEKMERNQIGCDKKSSSEFSISVFSTNNESRRSEENLSDAGMCYGNIDLPRKMKILLKQYEDTQHTASAKPGTLVQERVHGIDSKMLGSNSTFQAEANTITSTIEDTPKRLLPALELWEKAKQQARADTLN